MLNGADRPGVRRRAVLSGRPARGSSAIPWRLGAGVARRPNASSWRRALAAALFLLSAGAGCHLARMQPPGELAAVTPLQVSGRAPILRRPRPRFGDYTTRDVRRSWVRGGQAAGGVITTGMFVQRYRFVLLEKGVDRWAGSCQTSVRSAAARLPLGFELGPLARLSLRCDLATADSSVRARLTWSLSEPLPRGSGAVEGLARAVRIEPAYRVEHAWLPLERPSGYVLLDGERVVAAVDAMNRGRVFLAPILEPEERTALAAVAVVFLLFNDLHERYESHGD